jgi:hypothetical protein
MPSTRYGGKITFSWEFESSNLKILEWYEPPEELKPPKWALMSLPKKKEFVRDFQQKHNWGPTYRTNWSLFKKNTAAPGYLNSALKQEMTPRIWELTPNLASISDSVDKLFMQLEQVRAAFPTSSESPQAKGFQVHIVFEAPKGSDDNRNYWNSRIAALYQLLNDYSALKQYAKSPSAQSRGEHTGAAVQNLGTLIRKLNAASSENDYEIEVNRGIAWVGKYKYHNVGLRREVYSESNNLLGLEIRSGWKNNWARFRALVEKVVTVLENLDQTAHLKTKRPDASANFYLQQHLEFKRAVPPISAQDQQYLRSAALLVAKEASEKASPRLPSVGKVVEGLDELLNAQAKIIFERWMIALAPWEEHAAFSNDQDQRTLIQRERQNLVQKIHELEKFNSGKAAQQRKPLKELNGYFGTFYKKLRLYSYL